MEKTIYSRQYEVLRHWLKRAREKQGLTLRDVGKMLDVPHSFIQKVENGERRLDVIEYITICEALKLNPKKGIDLILSAPQNED